MVCKPVGVGNRVSAGSVPDNTTNPQCRKATGSESLHLVDDPAWGGVIMEDNLYDTLKKLPKENIINLMMLALDEMELYNGRSRITCIMLAMGATQTDDGKWKIPAMTKVIKNTERFF